MQHAYVFFFFFFAEGSKWNDVGFHFGRMGLLFILHFSISNNVGSLFRSFGYQDS